MTRRSGEWAAPTIWQDTPKPGVWAEDAACRKFPDLAAYFTDADTFEDSKVVMAICRRCPARDDCLDLGVSLRANGVWGGELLQRGRVRAQRSSRLTGAHRPAGDLDEAATA